jgi:hypothetical protein
LPLPCTDSMHAHNTIYTQNSDTLTNTYTHSHTLYAEQRHTLLHSSYAASTLFCIIILLLLSILMPSHFNPAFTVPSESIHTP